MKFVLLAFLLVFGAVLCAKPEYIHSCKKDATLPDCLKDNFASAVKYLSENGDNSIKAPDLKAIKIAKMPLDAGELKITMLKPIIRGLQNIKLDLLTMDDNELRIKAAIPDLQYDGDYSMKGKILILPIEGDGKMNNTHYNIEFDLKMKLKTDERNGKKYYFVTGNWDDVEMKLKVDHSQYYFGNLFGGDPRLGPEMNIFLNENNVAVLDEIMPALKEGLAFYIILPYINAFLGAIPINELFEK